MRHKSAVYALLGQLSLFGFLLVCMLLKPHFLFESNEGGISNYGLYAETVIPYTLAFGLGGLLTMRAALALPEGTDHYKALKIALGVLGLLLIVAMFSTYPYKLNTVFNDTHKYASVFLTFSEVTLGVWFAGFLARNIKSLMILSVELLGFLMGVLTYYGLIHILFIAEIVTGMAFGLLLVRTVAQLTDSLYS